MPWIATLSGQWLRRPLLRLDEEPTISEKPAFIQPCVAEGRRLVSASSSAPVATPTPIAATATTRVTAAVAAEYPR